MSDSSTAGTGGRSRGLGRQLEMIEVNIAALTRLTALLLPGMLERRRGGILNVASTAAFQPGPNSAVYYATKAWRLACACPRPSSSPRSPATCRP